MGARGQEIQWLDFSRESMVCSKERAPVNSDKLIIRLPWRKAQLMELPNDNLQGDLPLHGFPEPQAWQESAPGPEAHTLVWYLGVLPHLLPFLPVLLFEMPCRSAQAFWA